MSDDDGSRRDRILAAMREEKCKACDGLTADRGCDCCERIMNYRDAVCAWRSVVWSKQYGALPQTNALRDLDGLPPLPRLEYDFTVPRWHEMHAAGWMPGGPMRREVWCPAFGLVFDSLSAPGRFLAKHFEIMGEPVPLDACPPLHVLDTPASRTLARKAGVPSPSPESIWSAWR